MTGQAIRLLLVDDDLLFGDYLRILLQGARATFDVDVVQDVRGAIQALDPGGHHDVCLLDYRLGAEDGLDVLRAVRARGLRTPIVLLTAEQNEALELAAIEEGADDYLHKSELDPRRLERTVLRAMARRRVEAALHEREARLAEAEARALVMAVHVGLDGRWLKVPQRFCEFLGYTEAELLARRWQDVTHPADIGPNLAQLDGLLNGVTRSVEFEKRYLRKDGTPVWAYLNCSIVAGDDGTPIEYFTYVRDIGEQKRAEEALRASEQRYSSMVRRAPYGIFEVAADGRLRHGNPALATMLRVDSEEALGQIEPDALYESAAERRRVTAELFTPGRSTIETSWRRPDGSRLLVRLSAEVRSDTSEVVTAMAEDVTEQRQLEERLHHAQKMEAVGQLAGGVAHDFNNLLTAILGYAELVAAASESIPQARSDVAEIEKAAKTAAGLTAQLLSFSRKQMLRAEVLSINGLIRGMTRLLSQVLCEDVALEVRLGADVPDIEADPVQLQRVLLNLASNARDAMPKGGRLTIETSSQTISAPAPGGTARPPGRYALITVADTGCGMDATTQAHIFEPFFTTKGKGKGTGLGLATVYGIVSQSGGEVVCRSAPGAGATFSIFLPAAVRRKAAPAPQASAPASGAGTILLVEDQNAVRKLTRRILEARGYTVIDTGRPEEAVALGVDHGVDLLLTDVVMPNMSGPELATAIRARRPDLPVVFMSGYAEHSALDETRGAPLVRKPFTPEALLQGIRDALEPRKEAEAVA